MNEVKQSARDAARGEKIDPQGKKREADAIAAKQLNDLKAMRKQADKLAQGWPFVPPVFYQGPADKPKTSFPKLHSLSFPNE